MESHSMHVFYVNTNCSYESVTQGKKGKGMGCISSTLSVLTAHMNIFLTCFCHLSTLGIIEDKQRQHVAYCKCIKEHKYLVIDNLLGKLWALKTIN